MCPAHAIRDTSIIARSIPDFSRGRKERKRGRGTSFLELGLRKAVIPVQAQKRSADGRKTRRVGSAYHESACSTRSSGAVRRWWKGWPVEGFSVSQWPLFARQCKARGNDLVPLRRWYAPVAPQPASPSRHVDIAVRLPQREARPTLFSELARQPPYNASTHVASALSLRLIAPFSLIDGRITGVPCRLSFFFSNVSIEIFPSTLDLWNPRSISIFSRRRRRLSSRCFD